MPPPNRSIPRRPAMTAVRMTTNRMAARAPAIDPNVFIVQPPTGVQWTMGPAPEAPVAAIGR